MSRLAVLFALATTGISPVATAGTKLLRYPDIHKDRVVFTYAGDLWTASTGGGTATRLTAGPGLERSAKFSPDGNSIAFTGQYDGDEQAYVMPSIGGVPRQLTFYPALGPLPQRWGYDNQVYGWTPDGKAVLFRSTMDTFEMSAQKLFTVAVAGGMANALPMPRAGAADYAPDGRRMVYSPLARDHRTWKRYQGGWAQDLYVVDFDRKSWTNITNDKRTDRDPMWIGNAVYYVSDRDGKLNLFRYDLAGGQTTQLTRHTDWDARWASADAEGQIVYEMNGELVVYDTRTNTERRLDIQVPSDQVSARAKTASVAKNVEGFSLSSDGARALVVARGDVFSVPADKGITRNLTQSPGAHDREAAFSPDGKQVAYVSDADGEDRVYVRAADGNGQPRRITGDDLGRLTGVTYSPDGTAIAFSDKEGRIHVVDLGTGKRQEVANEGFGPAQGYAFSPQGRYLAYALSNPNRLSSIHVYDRQSGTSTRVGDGNSDEGSPAFSPDGKYLYMLANHDHAPAISGFEWDYIPARQTGIYALSLRRDIGSPIPPENTEAGPDKGAKKDAEGKDSKGGASDKDKKKSGDDKASGDRIDFDGLAQRVTRLPIEADNLVGLAVTRTHVVYFRRDITFYGRDGLRPIQAVAWSFKDRKEKVLAEKFQGATISDDGSRLLVRENGGFKVVPIADGEPKALDTAGMIARRDPKAEYAEVFEETWRRFHDYFYAPNMHGYDWAALREQYRGWLPYVADRSDLNYLLGEMVAELNVSHAYVTGGDLGLPERTPVALLGARFELDAAAGRYRIAKIFEGDNAEDRYRSPLTEPGVDVKRGDYVLAINGRALTASDNPFELLRGSSSQLVELRVNGTPAEDGARTVLVRPIGDETDLKYLEWVNGNRRHVERASGGRIGYLHIPDMGADGIREFVKWYYPQIRKAGLVVDVRGNGGGNVSSMLIERLNRRLLSVDWPRTGDYPSTYPQTVFHGHMAALISETSASDGDIFPYMFRKTGLGPLIGKLTWGGVTGITDYGPVIDGGSVSVPQFPMIDTEGRWTVEGEGVKPDIEVENDLFSELAGEDRQLDRAIQEIEARIKSDPRQLPTRPADPVKTQ